MVHSVQEKCVISGTDPALSWAKVGDCRCQTSHCRCQTSQRGLAGTWKKCWFGTFKLTSMEVPRCWYHHGRAQRRHACVLEAAYHGLAWLTFAGFSQVTYASGHKPLCETGLCSALDRVARASVTLEIGFDRSVVDITPADILPGERTPDQFLGFVPDSTIRIVSQWISAGSGSGDFLLRSIDSLLGGLAGIGIFLLE